MFSFYRLVETLDQLNEYKWEKGISTMTKLKPSVFFPLRKAKKETKRSWEARARMRDPGRVKEVFKGSTPLSGKRASSFLSGVYRASREVAQKNKAAAQQAAKVEGLKRTDQLDEFYLDPSLRPSIKRLAKSGTEIKDPVTKKNFFRTIRVLALQRQKVQKAAKTEE